MSRPMIAVDFDDVILPTSRLTIEFYNKTYGTSLTMADAYTYADASRWLADHTTVLQRVNDLITRPDILFVPPLPDAIDAITTLADDNSFVVVTGRAISTKAFAAQWLHSYFGDACSDFIFMEELQQHEPNISKLAVCQRLGVTYLIDDMPLHLNGHENYGVSGVLFGDYPWNHNAQVTSDMVRCSNWAAVKEYFNVRTD